eukprot:scaffold37663_cov64-Phaeocystis_antarctica.AAC.1
MHTRTRTHTHTPHPGAARGGRARHRARGVARQGGAAPRRAGRVPGRDGVGHLLARQPGRRARPARASELHAAARQVVRPRGAQRLRQEHAAQGDGLAPRRRDPPGRHRALRAPGGEPDGGEPRHDARGDRRPRGRRAAAAARRGGHLREGRAGRAGISHVQRRRAVLEHVDDLLRRREAAGGTRAAQPHRVGHMHRTRAAAARQPRLLRRAHRAAHVGLERRLARAHGAGRGHLRQARHAAARRADQPPEHRRRALAGARAHDQPRVGGPHHRRRVARPLLPGRGLRRRAARLRRRAAPHAVARLLLDLVELRRAEIAELKEYAGHGFKYGGSSSSINKMKMKEKQ